MNWRGHFLTAAALAATTLTIVPTVAASSTQPATDGYVSGDYGRIRNADRGLQIQRSPLSEPGATTAGAGADAVGINAPVFPGDTVLTASDQRVEIELASGTLVRIDHDSEVTFLALPAPYGTPRDNTVLQLAAGALRVDSRIVDAEEFRVDTPAATIYLVDATDARIEVGPYGETELVVRRGVVEAVSDAGSTLVRGGMRTTISPQDSPAAPTPFNTFATDGFDHWVAERVAADRYAGSGEAYEALPDEVRPYYRELSVYGDWDYEDDYGYVWAPRTVERDWRPYRSGYWHYGPAGYFWVASENWGWAPYHYGRWVSVRGRWCWTPGRVFGGAWVAWSWGASYVGWAPLDYWNRPAWVATLQYDYYDPRCWTFVRYDTLAVTRVGRPAAYRNVYTTLDVGAQLTRSIVVTRAPNVSPEALRASPDARATAVRVAREDSAAHAAPPTSRTATKSASFVEAERSINRQLVREAPRSRSVAADEPSREPRGRERSVVPAPREVRVDADRRTMTPSFVRTPSTNVPGNSFQPQRTSDPRDLYRRMSERPRTRTETATPSRTRADEKERKETTRKKPEAKPRGRTKTKERAAPKKEEKPKTREAARSRQPSRTPTSSRRAAPKPRPTSRSARGRRSTD